jgi:hypothetical protein
MLQLRWHLLLFGLVDFEQTRAWGLRVFTEHCSGRDLEKVQKVQKDLTTKARGDL